MVKATIKLLLLGSLSFNCYANDDFNAAMKRGEAALDVGFIDSLIKQNKAMQNGNDERVINYSLTSINDVNSEQFIPTYNDQITYKILISSAMDAEQIQRLFSAYQNRGDVTFYIRGLLPEEKTITDAALRVYGLVKEYSENVPNVFLDPTPFDEVGAKVAPMILAYQGKEVVSFATGLTNTRYMYEQLEKNNVGDLGSFGDTILISERSLTDILKERSEKLDKDKIIADAKANYWPNVDFLQLPEATETRDRLFTPMLTLGADVVAQEGVIIARKGDSFNTLDRLPFTMRIVVFDATNEKHIEFIKSLPKSNLRTKLITTKYDRKKEWNAIKDVEKKLNSQVFMLNRDILNAFDLRAIPSVVVADNKEKHFVISEFDTRGLHE